MDFFTPKNTKRNVTNGGFTLVEMIVAVGLFVAVFIAISSSFISIVGAYKKVSAERINVDNLSTAIESMVRGIKTGTTYHCGSGGTITDPQDCSIGGDTYISFKATNPDRQIIYSFFGDKLQRSENGGSFYPVTENTASIKITYIRFYVFGTASLSSGDTDQPRVIIIIKGTSGVDPVKSSAFSVQTTITQRLPDVD